MEKHKLIIELAEPLNVEEFNHLCGFLEGAEGIQNKYSTINEESVPAETLVRPKIAEDDEKVFNGDYFIHERTGLKYAFYSEILGTKLERC